jgi:hypothetical protein
MPQAYLRVQEIEMRPGEAGESGWVWLRFGVILP